jgi:phospholipase C
MVVVTVFPDGLDNKVVVLTAPSTAVSFAFAAVKLPAESIENCAYPVPPPHAANKQVVIIKTAYEIAMKNLLTYRRFNITKFPKK